MLGSTSVRSLVVAGFLLLLAISHIDVCAAKSLGLQDDYWSPDAIKRNSWWSKKSLDSAPDFNRLIKDSPRDDMSVGGTESADLEYDRDTVLDLFDCYSTTCVPEFVRCAQRSGSHRSSSSSALTHLGLADRADHLSFKQCQRNHELCGLECRVSSSADSAYGV